MSPAKLNLTSSAPIVAPIPALSYNRINSVVIPFLELSPSLKLHFTSLPRLLLPEVLLHSITSMSRNAFAFNCTAFLTTCAACAK